MAKVKVSFTIDPENARKLRAMARATGLYESNIVDIAVCILWELLGGDEIRHCAYGLELLRRHAQEAKKLYRETEAPRDPRW